MLSVTLGATILTIFDPNKYVSGPSIENQELFNNKLRYRKGTVKGMLKLASKTQISS